MENVVDMIYVGHNHFSSKDKRNIYYIIQALYNIEDITRHTNKATLINIFVDDKEYQNLSQLEVGCSLKVEIKPNLEAGKLSYKIVK